MVHVDSIVITDEFRSSVSALVARVGPVEVVAQARWQSVVNQLEITPSPTGEAPRATLAIGSPAHVLKQASRETSEFGFVMLVAQLAKWWQRVQAWRDDATLELWRAGWSPLTIDRLITANDDAPLEFVIGSARPIPGMNEIDPESGEP